MKKNVIWLLAVLSLLAVSCVKEQIEESNVLPEDMPSITATYPAGVETKVSINDDGKTVWDKGDAISVFNRNEVNQKYTLHGDAGSSKASFKYTSGTYSLRRNFPYVCAVYPYSSGNGYDGKVVRTEFISGQSYKENSFDPDANLMVAVSKNFSTSFKHVGGFMLLKLYGEGVKVSNIELKGNNGEILAGPANVKASISDVPEISFSQSTGVETLTLSAEEPVAISADEDDPTEFWFVVPPTVFGKGFTLTVTDADGNVQNIEFEDKAEIERKAVYSVGPVGLGDKEESVSFDVEVEWTYDLDSEIDHNLYYEVGEPYDYSRKAMALGVDPSVVEKYGAEISSATPDGITVKVVDDESGEEVEAETVKFSNIILQGDDLVADFDGFEWDKTYKVEALYTLGSCEFTLSGTLTTVDRNREVVTLSDALEYTFEINKYDEATGFGYIKKTPVEESYYYWESDPVMADIYDAFLLGGVIKADDFADANAFATAEVLDKTMKADPAGSADGYVQVNKTNLRVYTNSSFKENVLKGDIFNSGKQDVSDPDLFVGNEVDRMITTYIGQIVRIPIKFNYRLGGQNVVSFETKVVWTYDMDSEVDHSLFYEDEYTPYSHEGVALGIDPSVIEKYGDEIEGESCTYCVVKLVDDESGVEEITTEVVVENIILQGDDMLVDLSGFEWEKTYKIEIMFALSSCDLLVSGTLTTVDRNREVVTLSDALEYTFEINKYDETTGFGYIKKTPVEESYYYWESDPVTADIYDAFLLGGVIKADDFADANAFATAEVLDKTMKADPAGSADDYVLVNKTDFRVYTNSSFKASVLKGDIFNSGKQDASDPYLFVGNVADLIITTYIGQTVRIPIKFNYRVPAYDFAHQLNYTFDDGKWYSMASPMYYSNKARLESYDVNKMLVPAFAFNIIDGEGRYFNYVDETVADDDPDYFYDSNLSVRFDYSGQDIKDDTALESESRTGTLTSYGDLWSDPDPAEVVKYNHFKHSVFYYRSFRDAIPMCGTLEVASGDTTFEIPTSFEAGNGGKYLSGKDYSNFELRGWKPFYVLKYDRSVSYIVEKGTGTTINYLKHFQFYDGRQVAASSAVAGSTFDGEEGVYVVNDFNGGVKSYFRPMLGLTTTDDWDWIIGDTDISGYSVTDSSKRGNGYMNGIISRDAYGVSIDNISVDLSSIPSVCASQFESYPDKNQVVFNDSPESDVDQFGFTVTVNLKSPWYQFKPFTINVEVIVVSD